jgi:hypothetical protein
VDVVENGNMAVAIVRDVRAVAITPVLSTLPFVLSADSTPPPYFSRILKFHISAVDSESRVRSCVIDCKPLRT